MYLSRKEASYLALPHRGAKNKKKSNSVRALAWTENRRGTPFRPNPSYKCRCHIIISTIGIVFDRASSQRIHLLFVDVVNPSLPFPPLLSTPRPAAHVVSTLRATKTPVTKPGSFKPVFTSLSPVPPWGAEYPCQTYSDTLPIHPTYPERNSTLLYKDALPIRQPLLTTDFRDVFFDLGLCVQHTLLLLIVYL